MFQRNIPLLMHSNFQVKDLSVKMNEYYLFAPNSKLRPLFFKNSVQQGSCPILISLLHIILLKLTVKTNMHDTASEQYAIFF